MKVVDVCPEVPATKMIMRFKQENGEPGRPAILFRLANGKTVSATEYQRLVFIARTLKIHEARLAKERAMKNGTPEIMKDRFPLRGKRHNPKAG